MQLCTPLIPSAEQKILLEALQLRRSILIQGEPGTGKTTLAHWLLEHKKNHRPITQIYLDGKNSKGEQLEVQLEEKTNQQHEIILIIDAAELIPLLLQMKIVRLIDRHRMTIISTANLSLAKKVVKGEFRADLYSRLKHQSIVLKPLRELPECLPEILRRTAFLRANLLLDKNALQVLARHPWPGNLREVSNLFENLRNHPNFPQINNWELLLRQKTPMAEHIKNNAYEMDDTTLQQLHQQGLRKFLKNMEQLLVQKIYQKNQGHVRKTLQDLKISSGTFYRAITPS
ncbi:MAG: hypothetical protein HYV97_08415 [Bdellovibrio sp.]|nr:hypothetical protein [Bdellovibrio sp.]